MIETIKYLKWYLVFYGVAIVAPMIWSDWIASIGMSGFAYVIQIVAVCATVILVVYRYKYRDFF